MVKFLLLHEIAEIFFMHFPHMSFEVRFLAKALLAEMTKIRSISGMNSFVVIQMEFPRKPLLAETTYKLVP